MGGAGDDYATAIATASTSQTFITGTTTSVDWTSGGFDTSFGGGSDAFAIAISTWGWQMWSTYLGGVDNEACLGIDVNTAGEVLVTGSTKSSGWVAGNYDTTRKGGMDAFLVKLSPTDTAVWSTYLGGSDSDEERAVTAGPAGEVYVTGRTNSPGWTAGGFDTNFGDNVDGFLLKICDVGAVRVMIGPEAAVAAGAHWRPVGTTDWLESGAIFSGLTGGRITIEFLYVDDWIRPPEANVDAQNGVITQLDVIYQSGPEAVDSRSWNFY
ncbi:MAG: hypothetical protein M1457_07825 [bacterium]|nr:hypothetical protein [bacterium]